MLKMKKTINLNGTSSVKTDSGSVDVMTMNARVDERGAVTCTKDIQDMSLYKQNKAAADADYEEFETAAYAFVEE